jgi:hypothetical protein
LFALHEGSMSAHHHFFNDTVSFNIRLSLYDLPLLDVLIQLNATIRVWTLIEQVTWVSSHSLEKVKFRQLKLVGSAYETMSVNLLNVVNVV